MPERAAVRLFCGNSRNSMCPLDSAAARWAHSFCYFGKTFSLQQSHYDAEGLTRHQKCPSLVDTRRAFCGNLDCAGQAALSKLFVSFSPPAFRAPSSLSKSKIALPLSPAIFNWSTINFAFFSSSTCSLMNHCSSTIVG